MLASTLSTKQWHRALGQTVRHGAGAPVGYHLASVAVPAVLVWVAYVVLAVGLLARAIGLPLLQSRRADGPRRLRPVHVGLAELAASVALIATALLVRF